MDSIFEEASALYQIPSKLLRAVAKAESGFNPKAVSKAGLGVMQLMPGTARSLGVSDPHNARQNILGRAKYLKQNLDRFPEETQATALAAYNAGPNSVTKYGGIPPYKETQNYVKKIMADYTGNNTILAGRTVSTGTYGKTSGSTAVSSLIGSGLTGSGLMLRQSCRAALREIQVCSAPAALVHFWQQERERTFPGKTVLIWCRSSVFR